MNPLTLVKRIQKINSTEASLGISEDASWHAKYKDSAYVFVGGVPFDLTEGDLLAVFAQYGEVVDVNLVREKATGKSKGFAFLAYEDQRSTILAVDNLNGAKILGRIIRVDHVSSYKKKEEEDEEAEREKREVRGVCHAFQRGECNRGSSCKFSHNEQIFVWMGEVFQMPQEFMKKKCDVLTPVGVRRIVIDGAMTSMLVLQKATTKIQQMINSRWMNTRLDIEVKTGDIDARLSMYMITLIPYIVSHPTQALLMAYLA